jgi:lipopolysaccharide/colanic/teichoic acid biosynthesis glycosyltransferase
VCQPQFVVRHHHHHPHLQSRRRRSLWQGVAASEVSGAAQRLRPVKFDAMAVLIISIIVVIVIIAVENMKKKKIKFHPNNFLGICRRVAN